MYAACLQSLLKEVRMDAHRRQQTQVPAGGGRETQCLRGTSQQSTQPIYRCINLGCEVVGTRGD